MKKKLLIPGVLLLVFICIGAANAQTIQFTLADLIEGQSITAGDKLFDRFWYGQNEADVNLADIGVAPLHDGGLDPGPGLEFLAMNNVLTVSDGNSIHLAFGFRVSTIGDLLIKDNSLNFLGSSLSYISEIEPITDLGIAIGETVTDAAGNLLGKKYIEFSVFHGELTSMYPDHLTFDPVSEIFVTKNIEVWTENEGETANLGGFTQRFSQTPVPEPATMLLLGTGLAGIAGASRRRKKNQA